jgi:hypothetical protein
MKRLLFAFLGFAWGACFGILPYLWVRHNEVPPVTFVSVTPMHDLDRHYHYVANDSGTRSAALEAALAWSAALGRFVAPPVPFYGKAYDVCDKDYSAMACSYEGSNVVFICRNMQHDVLVYVLEHEIGHLLGVPHIEGDWLMEPVFDPNHVVDKPTPFAIALAKAVEGK